VRRDRHGLPLPDDRKIVRADREFDPNATEISNREDFRLQVVPSDHRAHDHLSLDDPPGNWREHFLPTQLWLGFVRQSGDLRFRHPQREQLLARDVKIHSGLGGRTARPQQILLAADAPVPQDFLPVVQFPLQIAIEPRREIFALRGGNLTAFQNRHDLALGNGIAEPFAQLGNRPRQSDRHTGDPVGLQYDRARHEDAARKRAIFVWTMKVPRPPPPAP
jgi:hypothetical protein